MPKKAWLAAVLLLTLMGSQAAAVTFSAKEKARLRAGKTVIQLLPSSGKGGVYGGSGFALVDAPPEKVWETILNWKQYPKMFPHTEQCVPVSKKGNRTLVKMKIGHPVVNLRFHVEAKANRDKWTLEFHLVSKYPHDIDSITGYWRLFPQPGGRTLVAYVVSVHAPPGIVAIAGEDLANAAIRALLAIPGDVRDWLAGQRKYVK